MIYLPFVCSPIIGDNVAHEPHGIHIILSFFLSIVLTLDCNDRAICPQKGSPGYILGCIGHEGCTMTKMMIVTHALLTHLPTSCPRGPFSASILIALSGGMDKLVVAWDFYKGRATQLIETGKNHVPCHRSYLNFNLKGYVLLLHPTSYTLYIEKYQATSYFAKPFPFAFLL